MNEALSKTLAAWESGEVSRSDLLVRHGEAAAALTALHARLMTLADLPVPSGSWAAVAQRLEPRRPRFWVRFSQWIRRPLALGIAGATITGSIAFASPAARHQVGSLWKRVTPVHSAQSRPAAAPSVRYGRGERHGPNAGSAKSGLGGRSRSGRTDTTQSNAGLGAGRGPDSPPGSTSAMVTQASKDRKTAVNPSSTVQADGSRDGQSSDNGPASGGAHDKSSTDPASTDSGSQDSGSQDSGSQDSGGGGSSGSGDDSNKTKDSKDQTSDGQSGDGQSSDGQDQNGQQDSSGDGSSSQDDTSTQDSTTGDSSGSQSSQD